jgi:lysophospholipase L1-like esterase
MGGWLYAQEAATSPVVAARDAAGVVILHCAEKGAAIRYTLDGSVPTHKSGPYLAPIELAAGGEIRAAAFGAARQPVGAPLHQKFDPLPGRSSVPATLVPCTQDRDWPIYDWAERHARVSALTQERRPTLVFVGDSITQMFGGEPHDRPQSGKEVWQQYYGKRNVANLGFGYDYVENTLWRLQHGELDGAAAKVVVLHIGTNNVSRNSPDEIAAGIKAICAEIRERQPQAKILLMAIFPRGPRPDATREKLSAINAQLAPLDGKDGVIFLDIGNKFLQPDGTLPKDLMNDSLHPTAAGYEIWAAAMEPTLKRLLGETE